VQTLRRLARRRWCVPEVRRDAPQGAAEEEPGNHAETYPGARGNGECVKQGHGSPSQASRAAQVGWTRVLDGLNSLSRLIRASSNAPSGTSGKHLSTTFCAAPQEPSVIHGRNPQHLRLLPAKPVTRPRRSGAAPPGVPPRTSWPTGGQRPMHPAAVASAMPQAHGQRPGTQSARGGARLRRACWSDERQKGQAPRSIVCRGRREKRGA
jgi:hypothetical protein